MLLLFLLFTSVGISAQADISEQVDISVKSGTGTYTPGDTGTLWATYTYEEGYHQTLQKQFFYFEVKDDIGLSWGKVKYPKGKTDEYGDTQYYGAATLKRSFTIPENIEPGTYQLTVTAGYQLCDDSGLCYPPEKRDKTFSLQIKETITEESDGSAGGAAGGAASEGSESGRAAGSESKASVSGLSGGAENNAGIAFVLRIVLFAFIGGIILNVMPCVLPVISIKAMGMVKQAGSSKQGIFIQSILYAAGVIASMLVFALIVILLKVSGEAVGWGFQFQNIWFVISLLSVIFLFALAMFDVFVISVPGMNKAAQASEGKGYVGSFVSGIFAVVLATPCTAPFLGTALGFAFSQPPLLIVLVFAAIGAGLALPFVLIGFWPGLVRKLPKPGPWMSRFKEVMGFLLLATAIWLLDVLYYQLGSGIINVLIFLLILGTSAWLYGRFGENRGKIRQVVVFSIALAVTVAGGWLTLNTEASAPAVAIAAESAESVAKPAGDPAAGPDADSTPGASAGKSDVDEADGKETAGYMETFSPEKVARYRKAGEPVFIDFSARWCLTCRVNEETVLFTKKIEQAFEDAGVHVLRGDYTNKDPVIFEWIQKFGKAGVPVYAYYAPGAKEAKVLPEILTKGLIIDLLKK